jgi:glycerol-3-phosphate dehydrogenase (NAD(P)+)
MASNTPLIICAKGIENNSCLLLSEVVKEVMPSQVVAILSGPNFADEVAANHYSISTIACNDFAIAKNLAQTLSTENFSLLPSDDIITTQIGGALKNVIAIACGIAEGLQLSANTKAAIFTKGMNDIMKFALAKNGDIKSILSPAVIGDMVLTCYSDKSRNMSFGKNLALGYNVGSSLTEGTATVRAATELAEKLSLTLEIVPFVSWLLTNQITPQQFIQLVEDE